ncbi:tetratricopeptide repeat protein [Frigidibacter sp. MR17.24]|uniref:tetratricopeptide repeat protein n=1 Tax=Frigidibacter sp. MR17.24 TaxID=3127345 RepID=UPI003012E877
MTTAPPPEILFDGRHLQVLHFARPSRIGLLSFEIMHARANGRRAFARTLCDRLGLNLVAVVPRHPCWYPAAEMAAAAQLCRERLGLSTHRIAYGASMGGYGALRWGRILGASHALACNPQISIDPDDTGPADRRYHRHFDPALHAGMAITAAHLPETSAILYDPWFAPDRHNAEALRALGPVHLLRAPHVAHGTPTCIRGSANALAIFESLIDGDIAAIQRRIARRRREDHRYYLNLARSAMRLGRPELARRIAARAEQAEPVHYHMYMVTHAMKLGAPDEAARHCEAILRIRPDHAAAQGWLARIRAAAG